MQLFGSLSDIGGLLELDPAVNDVEQVQVQMLASEYAKALLDEIRKRNSEEKTLWVREREEMQRQVSRLQEEVWEAENAKESLFLLGKAAVNRLQEQVLAAENAKASLELLGKQLLAKQQQMLLDSVMAQQAAAGTSITFKPQVGADAGKQEQKACVYLEFASQCSVNIDVEHDAFGEKLLGLFSTLGHAKKCAKQYRKENFMSENGDEEDEGVEDETVEESNRLAGIKMS